MYYPASTKERKEAEAHSLLARFKERLANVLNDTSHENPDELANDIMDAKARLPLGAVAELLAALEC